MIKELHVQRYANNHSVLWEAKQYIGTSNEKEIEDFIGSEIKCTMMGGSVIKIDGIQKPVYDKDWIIKDHNGSLYICDNPVFQVLTSS